MDEKRQVGLKSGEGSNGPHGRRPDVSHLAITAICASETFETTSRIDVKRSSGIAMVDVEIGTTTLPINDTGLRPRGRSEGDAIPRDSFRPYP